jgi:caffeic acid 3-O-methyltransferase
MFHVLFCRVHVITGVVNIAYINFLKNCNKALPQNGKVIIIDLVLPDAPESTDGAKFVSATDNIMLVILGGKERTAKELEALSKKSGFLGFHVNCVVYNVWGVMELYK